MTGFPVRLTFHGDLSFFLRASATRLDRRLNERTAVKDVIEACGVPHTEVDLILVNGLPVDFTQLIVADTDIEVFPIDQNSVTFFPENRLQSRHIRTFVADGHLGKLVRDLRLLGIDVLYDRDAEDRRLIEIAGRENRRLLTRDRRLLMHATLRHGYYLRSQNPLEQTIEVLNRFNLAGATAAFSRCLLCNELLEATEKQSVVEQLEPLTRIYYEQFRRCPGCGQIYWSGSHFDKLQKRIDAIRSLLINKA